MPCCSRRPERSLCMQRGFWLSRRRQAGERRFSAEERTNPFPRRLGDREREIVGGNQESSAPCTRAPRPTDRWMHTVCTVLEDVMTLPLFRHTGTRRCTHARVDGGVSRSRLFDPAEKCKMLGCSDSHPCLCPVVSCAFSIAPCGYICTPASFP